MVSSQNRNRFEPVQKKEFPPQIGIRISIEGLEQTNNEIRGLQNGYQRGYGTLEEAA